MFLSVVLIVTGGLACFDLVSMFLFCVLQCSLFFLDGLIIGRVAFAFMFGLHLVLIELIASRTSIRNHFGSSYKT